MRLCLIIPALLLAFANFANDLSGAVRGAIEPFVGKEVAGAVTLVARDGKVLSVDSIGDADVESGRPMQENTIFRIASMTKPTIGVAIMMLADEGKLNVQDPVEQHLPEFKGQWMIASKGKGEMVLKRPARKITLLDLATHTAGMARVEIPRAHSTLAEVVAMTSQCPLGFEPGSRWKYSGGGTRVLGRVVEVVSGQALQDFLDERLFGPLGMTDTTFFPTPAQLERLATTYERDGKTKQLKPAAIATNDELLDRKRTVKPGGGLFSTAEDMRRFYQMMLDGGVWKGKRLLSQAAVSELTRTQTGELKTGFTTGMSFGIKFQVVKEPQGVTAMLHTGTFGHGGAFGTQSWADPVNKTIYILMIQRRGFRNGDNSPVRLAFQNAAAEALAQ